jgi:hypothetical protein
MQQKLTNTWILSLAMKITLPFRRGLGALCVIPAILLAASPVSAAPGDGGVLADAPIVPLDELGLDPAVNLYGLQGTESLTFPVPVGMTPGILSLTTQLPVNVASGTITVSQDQRVLARVDIPPGPPVPIDIPLAGVEVADNAAMVVLRSYLLPVAGYCIDPTNPLRLTNAAVRYTGVEQPPTSVAGFLPPVLRRLTIFVGRTPTRAETDAVVRVAAAVAARYGKQDVRVDVAALDGPPPGTAAPFERDIVIREGPDRGASLLGTGQIPALLISGPSDELTNQSRLLTSGMVRFAVTSRAVVGPLNPAPQLPADVVTIRSLGQPGVNATALSPQVGIALDQTRLGRSAKAVRVHLIGSYTPLPTGIGGQIVVAIAGETLQRWPAEASGELDRWIDVPDRLLKRYTTLNVAVDISGNTGQCGEFQPITLTVDGATEVSSRLASPPVPTGLQSMPQALMPRIQIGIGPDVFADTVRAVKIVTDLQRLSTSPLATDVTSIDDALASPNPALVISANGWDHPDVKLPVTAPNTVPTSIDVVGIDGRLDTTEIEPGLKFGSLQTVFQNGRALLVATSNGAPEQLDALLGYLDADTRNWSSLDTSAVIQVAGLPPLTVPVTPLPQAVRDERSSTPLLLYGAAAAAVVTLGAGLLLRARRRSTEG